MTQFGVFSLFLFLHVLAAIIAFGPTFIFPIIGGMSGKEPMHGNFGLRITEVIEDRVVIPFALTMPVTGVVLIATAGFNLADRTAWWLDIGIVLYVIALVIALFLQRPLLHEMVHITSAPPPAGGPPGPPPGLLETAAKVRRNGAVLGILIFVIVLLMTTRPQF